MFSTLREYWQNILHSIECYRECMHESGNFLTCLLTNDGQLQRFELVLLGLGFAFWTAAYIGVLRNIHRYKIVEIPIIVAAMDVSYELIWGFLNFENALGLIFNIGNIIWFAKDLHINFHAVKYGHKLVTNQWVKRNYRLIYLFVLLNSFFITYFMSNGSNQIDDDLGLVAAYFINLMISGLYVYQILSYPEYRNCGFSYRVAWAKLLGTGFISVVCFTNPNYSVTFLRWMCLSVFVMDLVYIYLFKFYQPAPAASQPASNSSLITT